MARSTEALGHHGHHLLAHGLADFLDRVEVERVAHGEVELVLLHAHRDDRVLLGDVLRDDGGQLRRDIDFAEVYVFDTELHLQRFDELILRDDAVGDQHLAQTALLRLLQREALVKFLLCDRSRGEQQLTKAAIEGHDAHPPFISYNLVTLIITPQAPLCKVSALTF